MEIKNQKKGFVYTLEAVLASALFLSTVLVVVPEVAPNSPGRAVQRDVHSALQSLDKTGELRDKITVKDLEKDIRPYIPPGFNYTVKITSIKYTEKNVSSPSEFYLDKSGNYAEAQFWIEDAQNLNISFNGEKIGEDIDNSGYKIRQLDSTEGFLNFTGSGRLHFRFNAYSEKGENVEKSDVRSAKYLLGPKKKSIQVLLWSE